MNFGNIDDENNYSIDNRSYKTDNNSSSINITEKLVIYSDNNSNVE